MRTRTRLTAFVITVASTVATPSFAQTPATPPAAPPAAAQPAPCTGPEYRQFDFWIGVWSVKGAGGKELGVNQIESIYGGCAVRETWKAAAGFAGTSLNIYDARDGKWHQTWVDNQGNHLVLAGALKDGNMDMTGELLQNGQKALQRVVWEPLKGGGLRQVWTASRDGGKTWTTVFDGTYSRKQ